MLGDDSLVFGTVNRELQRSARLIFSALHNRATHGRKSYRYFTAVAVVSEPAPDVPAPFAFSAKEESNTNNWAAPALYPISKLASLMSPLSALNFFTLFIVDLIL